jgi:hypothetical protein
MFGHPAVSPAIQGKLRGGAADRAIAALAARQHDTVARVQLIAAGVSEAAIDHRLAEGRLRPVFRGVYAVGPSRLTAEGWCMAAVLFAGAGAVASHRSAGAVWGICRPWPSRPEVTVRRERRQHRHVRFHYGRIEPDEVALCRGIPVTCVPRTLLDMAADLTPTRVAAAVAEAELRRLTHPLSLHDLLERYPSRRGARTVRELVTDREVGARLTRSELELAFLEFLVRAGLPLPETNVWLAVGNRWIEVDCVWREQRLIAELDGRATHLTPAAFDNDRARDRSLAAARWRTVRVTWRHVHGDEQALEADLRTLLAL